MHDVVFPCGWIAQGDDLRLYYGAADTTIAMATAKVSGVARLAASTLGVPISETEGKQIDMRIAMLSPVAWRTPPRDYGPWEQVVSLLTEGLVRRGIRRHPVRHGGLVDHRHASRGGHPWL